MSVEQGMVLVPTPKEDTTSCRAQLAEQTYFGNRINWIGGRSGSFEQSLLPVATKG